MFPDMLMFPIGVAVGVAVLVGEGDAVGVGLGAAGPQGVSGPTATRNCVPPRETSDLLEPLAPLPAVVNVLPRKPTKFDPGAITE